MRSQSASASIEDAPESLHLVMAQHHRDLEHPEATRRFKTVVVQELSGCQTTDRYLQVFGLFGKSRAVQFLVAQQGASDVAACMQPFVQVKGK